MYKRLFWPVLIIITLFCAAWLPNRILGSRVVSLKNDPLAAAVASGLATSGYQPIEGKDYTVSSTNYFDGGSWIVVSINPVGTAIDPGKLVFQKTGGQYQKILGPSNFFQTSDLTSLPSDVGQYLLPESLR